LDIQDDTRRSGYIVPKGGKTHRRARKCFTSSSCDQSVFSGYHISKRQDSIVSIVPRVWAGRFRVQFPAGTRNASFFSKHPDWLWGPSNLLGELGLWKWQGHESDHSLPYSAEVKNQESVELYLTSPLSFHGFCRENFTPIVYHIFHLF